MNNLTLPILDPAFVPRIDLNEKEIRSIISTGEDWMVLEGYKHNLDNQIVVVEESYLRLADKYERIPTAIELLAEIQYSHNLPIIRNTSKLQSLLLSKYGVDDEIIDFEEFEDDGVIQIEHPHEDPVFGIDYQEARPLIHIMRLIASRGHCIALNENSPISYLVQDGAILYFGSSQNVLIKDFIRDDLNTIFLMEDVKKVMEMKPSIMAGELWKK